MDWDDLDSVLFDGTIEEINSLICPECGGTIEYEYDSEYSTFTIRCLDCGTFSKGCGTHYTPICTKYFGDKYRIDHQSKN